MIIDELGPARCSSGTQVLLCLEAMTLIALIVARQASPTAGRERTKNVRLYLLKGGSDRWLHLSVSGVCETDCDRCCLAQVSFVCPLSHLKTDWPKGCLTGGSAALPVGRSDGRGSTGCSVFPSCACRFCSCPLGCPPPTKHTPVQSLRHSSVAATRSPEREVMAKEGSHQQETQWPVCLTEE